jgi:Sec-independent protein secretion pathway component TatC
MRYLIAIIVAVIFAGAATVFASSPIASWVVRQFTFESPDAVANLHAAVFMLSNLAALVVGFLVGWAIGSPFRERT